MRSKRFVVSASVSEMNTNPFFMRHFLFRVLRLSFSCFGPTALTRGHLMGCGSLREVKRLAKGHTALEEEEIRRQIEILETVEKIPNSSVELKRAFSPLFV